MDTDNNVVMGGAGLGGGGKRGGKWGTSALVSTIKVKNKINKLKK